MTYTARTIPPPLWKMETLSSSTNINQSPQGRQNLTSICLSFVFCWQKTSPRSVRQMKWAVDAYLEIKHSQLFVNVALFFPERTTAVTAQFSSKQLPLFAFANTALCDVAEWVFFLADWPSCSCHAPSEVHSDVSCFYQGESTNA